MHDLLRKVGRREWTRTIDPHHVKVGADHHKDLILKTPAGAWHGKYTALFRVFRQWISSARKGGRLVLALALSAPLAHAETDLLVGAAVHHFDRQATRAGDWCEALPLLGIERNGWTAVAMKSSNCRLGIIGGYTAHSPERHLGNGWRISAQAMAGAGVLGWESTVRPVLLLGGNVSWRAVGFDLVIAPARRQGFAGIIGRVRL